VADMLVSAAELGGWMREDLDPLAATLVIEAATARVQMAARQRLVAVAGDMVTLPGTAGPWLPLPERPVTAVASVTLDGATVTDYQRRGSRLWRERGWQDTTTLEPSEVAVVYSHGHAAGAQALGLAREHALRLAAAAYSNPAGAQALAIDDYRESYGDAGARLSLTRHEERALRRAYGAAVGTATLG
jgi:hypothetical protein